ALDKRGCTQTKLAELLGITARQVRNYVKDEQIPDLNELANLLEFPVHFFTNDERLPELKSQAVSFRARSRTSKRLEKQALNHSITAFLLNDWLETEFTLIQIVLTGIFFISPLLSDEFPTVYWWHGHERKTILASVPVCRKSRIPKCCLNVETNGGLSTCSINHP
ncbi:helix-turn-helix transcriptional regulator, partial [Neisseria meningitidis]|nr:helix-turn-helix transcriptional regulator [Neisseria meningitidis]